MKRLFGLYVVLSCLILIIFYPFNNVGIFFMVIYESRLLL